MMMQAGGPGGDPRNMGGLLNPAANYQYPLTSGLMGAIGNATNAQSGQQQPQVGQMPAGVPNYSQIAYESAGSPHYGPYAQVAPPSGIGVPGTGAPSSGSKVGAAASGLLSSLVQNPTMLKDGVGAIKGLLGGAPPAGSPTPPDPQMTQMPFDPAAATAGALPALAAALPSAAPTGVVIPGALESVGAPAAAAAVPAASALSPIVPTASYMTAPAAAAPVASASAAGAGSLAGGLLGVGIAAAPLIAGLMTPGVQLGGKYWSNLAKTLNAGPGSTPQQNYAYIAAQNELANNMQGNPYTQAQLNAWGIPQVRSEFTNPNLIGGAGGVSPTTHLQKA